jgi:hypothetical protein
MLDRHGWSIKWTSVPIWNVQLSAIFASSQVACTANDGDDFLDQIYHVAVGAQFQLLQWLHMDCKWILVDAGEKVTRPPDEKVTQETT